MLEKLQGWKKHILHSVTVVEEVAVFVVVVVVVVVVIVVVVAAAIVVDVKIYSAVFG
jgi:hypothetical protein